MKILMLCNKSPWPRLDGGAIGMHVMITGLVQAGHTVKVIAANTNKTNVNPNDIPDDFKAMTQIEFVYLNLRLNPFDAIYNLIIGRSYHISRFYSKEFENKIISILKNETFDIVQLEYLPMALYMNVIRQYSKAPVVLREHNIEHLIWKRISENTYNILKKWYLKSLYKTLKKFEIDSIAKADGVVAVTPVDARNLSKLTLNKNIISIPTGLNIEDLNVQPIQADNNIFFHLGAMNWYPNIEGIKWLVKEVWPQVLHKIPNAELHLAGRYMPEWLKNLSQPGVIIDGEVDDSVEYMRKYSIMLVPLFSGSGIRIKIIEGMASSKAIITTSIGAEGINCEHGKELLIAQDETSFVEAIVKLYNDAELRKTLGINAYQLILREHDNKKLMEKLSDFYSELIRVKQN